MIESKFKILCMYFNDKLIDTNFWPYENIQCGKAISTVDLGMLADDTGDNISKENPYWSEITGLYWAWKNMELPEYVGLCSYRRFFNFQESQQPIQLISKEKATSLVATLNTNALESIFLEYDVVLPVPYKYAWSIRRVCSMNYKDDDFDKLEQTIKSKYPDFYPEYIKAMYHSNSLIGHNMFIMKKSEFEGYCEWVFSILFELSGKIDPENYSISQQRVFGYMHALLLSVYISKKGLRIKRSQLLWIYGTFKKSRFNALWYRVTCDVIFALSKVLGKYYPHLVRSRS